jgi:SsrA-binding protein
MEGKTVATNRRAQHDYEILERIEAGIELKGCEVKSLRQGQVNLKDSFARIESQELFLYNLHISPYPQASYLNVEPDRIKKLLVRKSQIKKLIGKVAQRGFTLIPLRIYFKGPWAKVELALAKGRRLYDRRQKIKKREIEREVRRALKKRR